MSTANLEEVIENSLTDATLPDEPAETETPEAPAPVEPTTEVPEAPAEAPPAEEPVTPEVPSPAVPPQDEFEKKFGIPAQSPTGRENRIPYSRVKKITEKAIADKVKELEGTFNPKIAEFETKVKDYETKLERVAKFEDVMINQPDKFLDMLAGIPTYSQFFARIREAFSTGQPPTAPAPQGPVTPDSAMPIPDEELNDGSKVYSIEGLGKLMDWHAAKIEAKVTKQIEERYKPIETEWETQHRIKEMLPQVQAQIAEARTWDQFNENEEAVVLALQANPNLSLEGAYRQIVLPKIRAERNKMREELLAEIKQAPRSTSLPAGGSRPNSKPIQSGPRNLEDVISEAIEGIK